MPEIVSFVDVKFESKTFIIDDTFAIELENLLDRSVIDVLNASCKDFVCTPTSVVTLLH